MNFVVIVPACFASTRLPEKSLQDINDKPMIVYVLGCTRASGTDCVIVATDRPDVASVARMAGDEMHMIRVDHQSGTERLTGMVEKCAFSDNTTIINTQGNEPMTPPVIVRQVAENLASNSSGMAALAVPIHDAEETFSPNAVKVVMDARGYAFYSSRATIPWDHDCFAHSHETIGNSLLRHIGIYGCRTSFIRHYVSWVPSPLEQIKMLKQLRVLWYGEKIHAAVAAEVPDTGVDTPEDLEHVRAELR